MWFLSNFDIYFIAGVVIGCLTFIFSKRYLSSLSSEKSKLLLETIKIVEVSNKQQCQKACLEIRSHCENLSALGFDCEWNTTQRKPHPIALLQLATVNGLCCLFRLNILKEIPQELQEILSDSQIIKLGISPEQDSRLLRQDYSAEVRSILDLRYLYPESTSLAKMAATEIGITLNKDWKITCSNWEATELSDLQKDYAAKDAFVAIEIFKKWLRTKDKTTDSNIEISRFLNIHYSPKNVASPCKKLSGKITHEGSPSEGKTTHEGSSSEGKTTHEGSSSEGKTTHECSSSEGKKSEKSSFMTRKSPLYQNCFMHAPDGELLCSCRRRKAEWYVERGLARVMTGNPYSIKLLFEPAARLSNTSEGRFYQHLKQNHCVVCGESNSYVKHNVVPKEYRKHFPSIMKDHQSHDIVLMCISCHQLASQHKEILRNALAALCDAPVNTPKVTYFKPIQDVKNSAKALISAGNRLPETKRIYLENVIKSYYKVDKLTTEILHTAAKLECMIHNKNDESHGLKVVEYFIKQSKGLRALELLWRKHFVDNMKPQYLPALWSVDHNNTKVTSNSMGKMSDLI